MEGDLKHLVAHEKMRELSSGHSCTGVCGSREQGSGGPMRSTSGREPCWTHRISGRKPEPGGHQLYSQARYAALSHSVSDCATPWTAARQASLSSSPRVYTQVHRVGDASSHLLLCHPLLLPPPIPPSIRVFSNDWYKYWYIIIAEVLTLFRLLRFYPVSFIWSTFPSRTPHNIYICHVSLGSSCLWTLTHL